MELISRVVSSIVHVRRLHFSVTPLTVQTLSLIPIRTLLHSNQVHIRVHHSTVLSKKSEKKNGDEGLNVLVFFFFFLYLHKEFNIKFPLAYIGFFSSALTPTASANVTFPFFFLSHFFFYLCRSLPSSPAPAGPSSYLSTVLVYIYS